MSAGRWSAAGAEESTGLPPPGQAAAGAAQSREAVPPSRRGRMVSPPDGRHRPAPAGPPFSTISTCGTGAVTTKKGWSAGKKAIVAAEAVGGLRSKARLGEYTRDDD